MNKFVNGETKVLKKYPSKSKPGKFYEVRLGRDNVTYCTCWQWIRNKDCSHLQDYLSNIPIKSYKKIEQDGHELYQIVEEEVAKLLI